MASTDTSQALTAQVVQLLLTDPAFASLMQTANLSGLGTVVDPRVTDYLKTRGITLPPNVYLKRNGLVGEDESLPLAAKIAAIGIGAATGASALSGLGNSNTPSTDGTTDGVDDIYKGLGKTGTDWGNVLRNVAKVGVPAAGLLAGRAMSGEGTSGTGQTTVPPELSAMLAQAMRRMAEQEPLFQATNRQALAGLPDYAKKGGG